MHSITKKVLIALIGATLVILLSASVFSYFMQQSTEYNNCDKNRKILDSQLQVILLEPVFSYDKALIDGIITALVKNEVISSIVVYDHRKKELGSAKSDDNFVSDENFNLPLNWKDNSVIGSISIGYNHQNVIARLDASLIKSIITLLVTLGLISVVIIIILRSLIIKPLNNLSTVLSDIASGGGDLTQRIPVTSQDEIGGLAINFNNFIETVQSIVRALANANEELRNVAQRVDNISETTNADTHQQSIQIKAALEHLTQLQSATIEIAQNAELTAMNTGNVQKVSGDSKSLMDTNLEQVNNLVAELDITADVVSQLRTQTQEINRVLDVIKGIAEQTNLLALNAAIEAARAGESGRGFSVVADEVRALASKTHDSTNEIEGIISSLQERAQASFDATHRSKDLANNTIETTRLASESLNDINHKIDDINNMNTQIASGSEEQTLVTKEVKEGMQSIDKGADRLANEADLLHSATVELTEVENKLVAQIQRFKY